jgi:hypothetical protein
VPLRNWMLAGSFKHVNDPLVSIKCGSFLSSSKTVIFKRKIVFHVVGCGNSAGLFQLTNKVL